MSACADDKAWRNPVEWALAIQAEYERAEREDDEFRRERSLPGTAGGSDG